MGWQVTGVELTETGAMLCASRGVPVVRGDARQLPVVDQGVDLVMSTDVWEHVEDHESVARESFRVLRRGGRLLVAVPAGMALWSGHDVALGHVRRYERDELVALVEGAGFAVHDVSSWNVLLRPVAQLRRATSRRRDEGAGASEMGRVAAPVNAGLRTVVALESGLPVGRLPGLSLVVRAFRP
jgi:SAM-dependent methyltransferase